MKHKMPEEMVMLAVKLGQLLLVTRRIRQEYDQLLKERKPC